MGVTMTLLDLRKGGLLRVVMGLLLLTYLLASCGQAVPCLEWQKCLGGKDDDRAQSVQQTADGGYIVAGYATSTDGDVKGNHGVADDWVVKLDASGNLVWQKCLGAS